MQRRPKGTGSIRTLGGNRHKKYQAVVTLNDHVVDNKIVSRQKSLGVYRTKKEADDALATYRLNNLDADGRDITFRQAWEQAQYFFAEKSRGTLQRTIHWFEPIADMRMIDVKRRHLQVIADNASGKSRTTQSRIKMIASAVFEYCIRDDYILKDYSKYMDFTETAKPKEKTAYTQEEVAKTLEHGEDWQRIFLYTGMRSKELFDLRMENVYIDAPVPYFDIIDAKTSAGQRKIPIHPKILSIAKSRLGEEYLIEHKSYEIYKRAIDSFNKEHGIPHTGFHDYRRTFATYCKKSGIDEFYRKAIMGHAQDNLTDSVYTTAFLNDCYKEICKLEY